MTYTFRFQSAECSAVQLRNGQLYVEVPAGEIPTGGKECFNLLLAHAEDHLDCTYVFVGLLKDRPDRESLMGAFRLMGFETVIPDHALCPNNPDYIYMAYTCTRR
ncbi:Ornithine decarboxylase antizyme 1 [Desmophyllum pertusum]|uniref:Ornithine decarboxylase antizyme n=1 Tax=Desmophyllum pertusum TaxID=174260 RepID=A0A9X0CN67_9CNID|nr:Ornithine decarboxylase antizyme 1 [Desmophyllum pertusum]